MKYKRIDKKAGFVKKLKGIAAVVGMGAAIAGISQTKPVKTYIACETSQVYDYIVKEGDSIYKFFEAENTKRDLSFRVYLNHVMYMNSYFISGDERNIDDENCLVPGRVIQLPDLNGDCKVGPKMK